MALVLSTLTLPLAAAAQETRPAIARRAPQASDNQRLEGQAVLALADAAMAGRDDPAATGLTVRWRNVFLKAQQGTFVPFTLVIDAGGALPAAVLVYVRAVPRGASRRLPERGDDGRRSQRSARAGRADDSKMLAAATEYPVDAIFPVDLKPDGSQVARVSRGFSIPPGDYDVYAVVRERPIGTGLRAAVRAAVVRQPLVVPDFRNGELTTSSVILADRLTVLSAPLTADELVERPYVIGQNEIAPSVDGRFRLSDELVVVLLVYNPTVTSDKRFDIQVEYHFFQRRGTGTRGGGVVAGAHPPALDGERYFNHTDPQRFNPAVMGGQFDPSGGHPVLAGQGIPLAGFDRGDYRLAITVTDLLSGTAVTRDVTFTVGS